MKQIVYFCTTLFFVNMTFAQVEIDELVVHLTGDGGMVKAQLVVEDSLGRKTGYDPLTETRYQEIPNAGYGDTGVDSHDPNVSGIYALEFGMDPATEGTYTAKVIGTGADTFELIVVMTRFRGSISKGASFTFTGTTSPGLVTEYEIFYDPDTTTTLTAKLMIAIDIKPGGTPNSINPKSNGVIPVAVLTNQQFDATTLDVSTAVFGPNGAQPKHNGHIEDVDGDGDDDLMLHFNTQNTGVQCGDTEMTLNAATVDGEAIKGTDSVQTVGCQ